MSSADVAEQVEALRASLALRYDVERSALGDALAARSLTLTPDAAFDAYLERAVRRRASRLRTTLRSLLANFLSDFDANGLTDCYPMHLLSAAQLTALLAADEAHAGDAAPRDRALDVGAGSGDVTVELAKCFPKVATTELSWAMARRLRGLGFGCERVDVSDGVPGAPWPAITAFNVLDRCPRPRTLLRALRAGLAPRGRLLLSMPLPYDPCFYDGAVTRDPLEPLPLPRATDPVDYPFERGARALVERALAPAGLTVTALGRVPYLSGGDAHAAAYELDAVVVVARAAD